MFDKVILIKFYQIFSGLRLFTISSLQCKLMLFFTFIAMVAPDWMTLLLSIDRLIAIGRGTAIWYKEKCTKNAAWIPIIVAFLLLSGIGLVSILASGLDPGRNFCGPTKWHWISG